jgi:apolipoprotein N-acyltransferase
VTTSVLSRLGRADWWLYVLAAMAGLATALALPRLGYWPLALVGLVPLFTAINNSSFSRAFRLGLTAGFVHFLFMVSWLPRTMELYAGVHWSLCYLAPVVLALYLALFWALFAGFYAWAVARGVPGLLAGPVFFTAAEVLRGWAFTGFAWMPLGNLLAPAREMIQAADLIGVYGLSFLAVVINYGLYQALVRPAGRRSAAFHLALSVALAAFLLVYGQIRIGQVDRAGLAGPAVLVSVVQGNIPPQMKHDRRPHNIRRSIDTYGRLTLALQSEAAAVGRWVTEWVPLEPPSWISGPHLVIWPETALVFAFSVEPRNLWQQRSLGYSRRVMTWTRDQNTWLLVGNVAVEQLQDLKKVKHWRDAIAVYNRATLIDSLGREAGHYDKVHLVPFGEYLPWSWLIGWLRNLSANIGHFHAGQKGRLLRVWLVPRKALARLGSSQPKTPGPGPTHRVPPAGRFFLGVLICYESIFPDLARAQVARGANLLVNITNDAWFGLTSAPYQHLAHMVLRAVENRRPVARAANTGISGFIDPAGRPFNRTELETVDARTALIPVLAGQTFFTRFGHYFDWLSVLAAFAMMVWMIILRKIRRKNVR